MARISTGPKVKKRSQQLFAALLDYANHHLPPIENPESPQRQAIEFKWQTDTELTVKTKLRYLETLTAQADEELALTVAQIREALNRLEDCLGILKDHRTAVQGSETWHFSLHFWYPRCDRTANLQRFETEWERYRQNGRITPLLPSPQLISTCRQDWDEDIDVSQFYGRSEELQTLKQWVFEKRCKVVTLLGMGGIGKTTIATRFAKQAQDQFDVICWRSLRNAPPLDTLLRDLVVFLSRQQDLQADLKQLLHWCQQTRCLLIFDNVETILQPDHLAGQYRSGFEPYGDLFRLMGTGNHQSCLLLTSREKPRDIAPLEGDEWVRSLLLKGSLEAALGVINAKQLMGTDSEKQALAECYSCSPLALKIAAGSIQDLFDRNIALFLAEGTIFFNGVRRLLNQQFERLSTLEQSILYWLAINRGWTSITELATDITPLVAKPDLLEALESLVWRNLIERQSGQYTLQPVVMEFVTEQLIQHVTTELRFLNLCLFRQYAFCKTTVLEYVRASQTRLILQPIAQQLRDTFGHPDRLQQHLQAVLQQIREATFPYADYSGGNLINLCLNLAIDLGVFDFSNLMIRQVDFQGPQFSHLNLAHTTFHHCLFTQTFSGIASVAFSPDNTLLAVGDTEGTLRLWHAAIHQVDQITLEQPYWSLRGHMGSIMALAWDPQGHRLATGSEDYRLKLWDAQTGECLHTLSGHQKAVWDMAFSPDGTRLVSSSGDHTLKLWNTDTGDCVNTLVGHQSIVYSVDWHPDGQTLASGSEDRTVRVWDVQSGQSLQTLPMAEARVRRVAWSPEGAILASGSADRLIRLWDGQTGQLIRTLLLPSIWINSLAWSPDGKMLASGGYGTVQLWDPALGECLRTLQGHQEQIWGLHWSLDSQTLVSGSFDQTVRFWNPQVGQCRRVIQGYFSSLRSVVWSPDGQKLASSSTDSLARIWDVETGQCDAALTGHQGWLFAVSWHPSQPIIASSATDTVIKLWNVETGQCLRTLSGHRSWVWSVAWSPDGQLLASGSSTGDLTARIWNPETGECLQILTGHQSWIWWVVWHPEGKLLATAGDDQQIMIWDVQTGELVQTLQDPYLFGGAIAWSPDGQWLATGSTKGSIQIWNLQTESCDYELVGHQSIVWGLTWSPDGQWLVSGGDDCTIKLWDVETHQCQQTFLGHEDRVWAVAWCPARGMFASSSRDGTVRLWEVDSRECLKILQAERPYEGMQIEDVMGLTEAQKATLQTLGAVE